MCYFEEDHYTPIMIVLVFIFIISLFIVIPISVVNEQTMKQNSDETLKIVNSLKSPVIIKSVYVEDGRYYYITVLDGDNKLHNLKPSRMTYSIGKDLHVNDTIR